MSITTQFREVVAKAAESIGYPLNDSGLDALCARLDGMESWRWLSRWSNSPDVEVITRDLRPILASRPPAPSQQRKAVDADSMFGVPAKIFEAMSPANRLATYRTFIAKGDAPATASKTETKPPRKGPSDDAKQLHGLRLQAQSPNATTRAKANAELAKLANEGNA